MSHRHDVLVVNVIQPYQARKIYTCPGCEGDIGPGMGHLVVVPELEPDLRRHWHRGCWFKEVRRAGFPQQTRGNHRTVAPPADN